MKGRSEAYLWEAREAKPEVELPQRALGAWVPAGAGRRQSDGTKGRPEAFVWEVREAKPDVEPPQDTLGVWVPAGAGR
jgi:hypothetical protein